jgi:hypothetical protein
MRPFLTNVRLSKRKCRFELDESNIEPLMYSNHETGELAMQKKDGMVNYFNSTVLKAIRCNMYIKFIGSGGKKKKC